MWQWQFFGPSLIDLRFLNLFKFSGKKFLIAGQKTFLRDDFSYAAADGNRSSCEPEFHDSCPKKLNDLIVFI